MATRILVMLLFHSAANALPSSTQFQRLDRQSSWGKVGKMAEFSPRTQLLAPDLSPSKFEGPREQTGSVKSKDGIGMKLLRGGCDQESGSAEHHSKSATFEDLLCTSRSEMIQAFRSLDTDESGVITKAELGGALEVLGIIATPAEVERIFEDLDVNKDESINFEVACNMD